VGKRLGKTVEAGQSAVGYSRPSLDKYRLGELIDIISKIGLGDDESRSKDILGRVEECKQNGEIRDWLFRPDKQLREEISRMQLPAFQRTITDYRLNHHPFFFKFVKRKIVDDSHQSFLVALDHLNQILTSPEARGPKDGIRLSYEALDGTYLREADMISLIRSG
jgi:hypothetical protein